MRMDNDFINWYHVEATEAERSLADRVGNLEGFFADMLFTPGTPSGELIKIQSKDHNADAEWFDDEIDVPEELEGFSHTYFTYRVEVPEDGCYGYFDSENQILCVQPSLVKDDATVLHEMIHMHEFVINELPMFYHDALLWSLYADLRTRIPGLDELIAGHAHILTGAELYRQGGLHDILFLLKSFDLDIKKGYPLGTVFAYERTEAFKEYSYHAETTGAL